MPAGTVAFVPRDAAPIYGYVLNYRLGYKHKQLKRASFMVGVSQRRLAAILFADIVGYSKLMGKDEAGTLEALQSLQFSLFDPLIGQHSGRVTKLLGDGILVEFKSVINAVECALAIQRGMISLKTNDHGERQIKLRIGVNLGEVLIDGDEIYGDGINVASRLQELADPDGICISSSVFGHIDGAIDHGFSDAGAYQLKNIVKAVRVFKYSPAPLGGHQERAFRPFIDLPVAEKPLATGGCLCGQVRYEVSEKALGSMLCHCRMCQRFSGAPMLEGTTFPVGAFRLTKGRVKNLPIIADCGTGVLREMRLSDPLSRPDRVWDELDCCHYRQF